MEYAAIPTVYRGVRFRSRLEARWAVMFDFLEWPWEYEPIDLAGYIPDFVLMFKSPILVEVKPELDVDWYALVPKHAERIERACGNWNEGPDYAVLSLDWNGETLMVGSVLARNRSGYFGAICDPRRGWWDWGPAAFVWCPTCTKWTPVHDEKHNDETCRFHGHSTWRPWDCNTDLLRTFWAEAQNTVQWFPRRGGER